jgi:hypothetical protein
MRRCPIRRGPNVTVIAEHEASGARKSRLEGFAMNIEKMLLLVGIVLMVARVLLGHHCWFLAVEAFVRVAAVALISAVAA